MRRTGAACPVCWAVCPDMSILEIERGIAVDYEHCKGCGLCAHECPAGAIDLLPERR